MPKLHYEGRTVECAPGETVLTSLLEAGAEIPNSCRSGVCQSCMLRATEGKVPEKAQSGLKDTLRAQGYFLSCVCYPEEDLQLSAAQALRVEASVEALDLLGANVMRVRLRTQTPLDFIPGQYVAIWRTDGLVRSYSIASLPSDGCIDLHVRRVPNGKMSSWIHEQLRIGDRLLIQGPAGSCFYTSGSAEKPLILAGTGTGLAPLWGILRDALRQGHTAPITLVHGGLNPNGLYMQQELRALETEHANFAYRPVVVNAEGSNIPAAPLDQYIKKIFPDLKGHRAYLCGDPAIVKLLQRTLFISGVSMKDIFADAFIPSPS